MVTERFSKHDGPNSEARVVKGLGSASVAVATDSVPFVDESNNHAGKRTTIALLATAMAGTPAVTGVTATSGTLAITASNLLTAANNLAGDPHSIFTIYADHDFHAATVKNTDLGALGYKCTLIGGYMNVYEAVAGGAGATSTITLGKAITGGTPVANVVTITKANTTEPGSNIIGAARAVIPVTAGASMAATDHIYAYTAAETGRTAGRVHIVLFLQVVA